jgi:GNAT superfamily N-acetyltransferase
MTVKDITLRRLKPGDIGWVAHRHGVLYADEYDWDMTFEALVASVGADFITNFKPGRDHAIIAEMGGRIVGSAFVVEASAAIAKLRLVYVEPDVRGRGLGERLVREAMSYARTAGYSRMTLWTNDVLVAARALYVRQGFTMIAAEPYRAFGKDLISETWEREL